MEVIKRTLIVLLTLFIAFYCCSALGQNKRKVNQKEGGGNYRNFYNKFNANLYDHLINLRYDSVKAFYFNREKHETESFSLSVDTPNIYNRVSKDTVFTQLKGSQTNDKGKLLSKSDSKSLVQILLNSNKDNYGKDSPVGIYAPSMGFVFFRKGKACAHLDVAWAYDKIELEVFGQDKVAFRYERALLGEKTRRFLKAIVKKYSLPEWVLNE